MCHKQQIAPHKFNRYVYEVEVSFMQSVRVRGIWVDKQLVQRGPGGLQIQGGPEIWTHIFPT